MNFAGALFALERGHKVRRHHWDGYWVAVDEMDPDSDDTKAIMMHTWDGKEIDIKKTNDIFYTLSNCACDDWEIVQDWNNTTIPPNYQNSSVVKR